MKLTRVLLLISISWCQAQTSYSELYKLLESRKNDEAEPLLRVYLKESKTSNPSALIFMGNILYEKALEEMMTDDDNATRQLLDSARQFYEQALSTLTEESFKGKEKYYHAFVKKRPKKITIVMVKEDVGERLKKIQNKLGKIRKSEQKSDSLMVLESKRQGKYYALIIGVSSYQNVKLNLDRPLKDALKFRDVLINHYTFESNRIILLSNPTRQQILKELYHLRKKVSKKDNLLVFYAGHAIGMRLPGKDIGGLAMHRLMIQPSGFLTAI